MPTDKSTSRSEVQQAEELLDRAGQKVQEWASLGWIRRDRSSEGDSEPDQDDNTWTQRVQDNVRKAPDLVGQVAATGKSGLQDAKAKVRSVKSDAVRVKADAREDANGKSREQQDVNGETQEEAADSGPLNINAAAAEELTELPGIGRALAERIIEQRAETGAFNSAEDLLSCLPQRTIDGLEGHIKFGDLDGTEGESA